MNLKIGRFFYYANLTSGLFGTTVGPMNSKKSVNFEIIPIFDQSVAGLWNNFLKIELACDKAIYDLNPPVKAVLDNRLREYAGNLREYKHNFAFVAYYRKQIIGFAQGFSISPYEMYLNRLYVSPTYHHCGVGSKLLKAVEQSTTIYAKKLSLIALANAADFYQLKHGYDQFEYMEKYITPTANSIVPVFQWTKKDFNLKFDIPVDTMELKHSKHQPVFVHVNGDCQIDAVATRMPNGVTKLWSATNKLNADSIRLLNALDKVR